MDDNFSFDDLPQEKRADPNLIWNVMTGVMLVLTLCIGIYFLILIVNPWTPLNPLQPPTPIKPDETATPTIAPKSLPATWTPSPTIEPTATFERPPTFTPYPSPTPLMLPTVGSGFTATSAPSVTKVPQSTSMPFTVSVQALESLPINGIGCNWLGVAGSAEDNNRSPILYLTVQIGGMLGDKSIDFLTVTGTAPVYGQGAFEFVLSDYTIESNNTLWIQLFDQAGLALSEKVYFNTYNDCKKNLILIRFRKVR